MINVLSMSSILVAVSSWYHYAAYKCEMKCLKQSTLDTFFAVVCGSLSGCFLVRFLVFCKENIKYITVFSPLLFRSSVVSRFSSLVVFTALAVS